MSELHLGDESRPYYVGYTIYDLEQATVNATLGALTAAHAYRGRILRTDVRVGDPSFDNSNFEGGAARRDRADRGRLRGLAARAVAAHRRGLQGGARDAGAQARRGGGAGGAAEDEAAVGDFSKEAPAHLEVPFPAGAAEPEALRETARKLSSVLADFPEIYVVARDRRPTPSSGAGSSPARGRWVDDNQRTVRIDVVAETQAADGMKLRSFVPFTALEPAGLPRAGRDGEVGPRDGQGAGRDARRAPVAAVGRGRRAVRGAGGGAAREAPARRSGRAARRRPRPPGRERRRRTSRARWRPSSGRRSPRRSLSAVDDPALAAGPGKAPLFGSYRVDDEGVPAQRVSLIEHGVLKSLLMSRTPRKEIVALERPRAGAALRGPARARRHAGGERRARAAPRGAARRAGQDRQGRRRHHLRRSSARRRFAAGRRGRRPGGAALVRRGRPRPAAGAAAGRLPARPRQGDAGARPRAREPPAALAQGHHGRRAPTPSSTTSWTGAPASRACRRRSSRRRCWSPTSTCGARPARNRQPPPAPTRRRLAPALR